MLTQLSSVSTDTKVAVATYATSRRISCFGRTKQAISYIDNEYQHGGKGHNLLNLALSKMVLKQFDKRPADRQTRDTARVSFTFVCFLFGSKLSTFKLSKFQAQVSPTFVKFGVEKKIWVKKGVKIRYVEVKTETHCKI